MFLIGDRDDEEIMFMCGDLHCLLNRRFNVILFTEHSVIDDNRPHPLGFIVPVDYLKFIKAASSSFTLKTDLREIFQFRSSEDCQVLKKYVRQL